MSVAPTGRPAPRPLLCVRVLAGAFLFVAGCSFLAPDDGELVGGSSSQAGGTDGGASGGAGGTGGTADAFKEPIALGELAVWVRADRGVQLSDGAVARWDDPRSDDRPLAQADATRRPSFASSSFGTQAAVAFDGVDDALTAEGQGELVGTDGLTFLAVLLPQAADDADRTIVALSGAMGARASIRQRGTSLVYAAGESDRPPLVVPGVFASNQPVLIGLVHGATGVSVYVAGRLMLSVPVAFDLPEEGQSVVLGKDDESAHPGFRGKVAELLVYRSARSTAEMDALAAYLAGRWGCCR